MHDKSMPHGQAKKPGRSVKEKRAARQAKKGTSPKHRKRIAESKP